MLTDELLHVGFTEEALEIEEELETLLVWDLRERVVWHVALDDRVEGRVAVVQTETYHILVH